MFNILSYKGNANQNNAVISSYHSQMAIIKKTNNKGCKGKGTCTYCWWECKLVKPLEKSVWGFLRKLKTEVPHDSVMLLTDI
jgi:hypothetical protein